MYIKSKKKSYQSSFFQVAGQDLIPSYDSAVTDAAVDSGWKFGGTNSLMRMNEISNARTYGSSTQAERELYDEGVRSIGQRRISRHGKGRYNLPNLPYTSDEFQKKYPEFDDELRILEPEEANERYGLDGALSWSEPVSSLEAYILNTRKKEEIKFQFNLDKAYGWESFKGFSLEMGMALVDPVTLPLMFIPPVGAAKLAGQFGWAATKTGSRFLRGGLGGLYGSAVVEVPIYAAAQQEQADYGLLQSFMNVTFGTFAGGGLHVGGGAVIDAVKHVRAKRHGKALDAATNQLTNGQSVEVTPITNTSDEVPYEVPTNSGDSAEFGPVSRSSDELEIADTNQPVKSGETLEYKPHANPDESLALVDKGEKASKLSGVKVKTAFNSTEFQEAVSEAAAQNIQNKIAFRIRTADGQYVLVKNKDGNLRLFGDDQNASNLGDPVSIGEKAHMAMLMHGVDMAQADVKYSASIKLEEGSIHHVIDVTNAEFNPKMNQNDVVLANPGDALKLFQGDAHITAFADNIKAGKQAVIDEYAKFDEGTLLGDGKKIAFDEQLLDENLQQTGEQMGTQKGGTYTDAATGKKYYVKYPKDANIAKNEFLAATLYKMFGVAFPETRLVTNSNGDIVGVASQIVDGAKMITPDDFAKLPKEVRQAFADDFLVDMYLGNWDVVGNAPNFNLMLTPDGTVFRIDPGGALLFRAQGDLKPDDWLKGVDIPELTTLKDPKKNPTAAKIYEAMELTEQEFQAKTLETSKRIFQTDQKEINEIIQIVGLPKKEADALRSFLVNRRQALQEVGEFGRVAQQVSTKKGTIVANSQHSAKKAVAKLNKAQNTSFDEAEAAFVKSYTGSGYSWLNQALRNIDGVVTNPSYKMSEADIISRAKSVSQYVDGKPVVKSYDDAVGVIRAYGNKLQELILKKGSLGEQVQVWRGGTPFTAFNGVKNINLSNVTDIATAKAMRGGAVKLAGFTSTGVSRSSANGFMKSDSIMLKINLPKGMKGLASGEGKGWSFKTGETEIILPHDTTFVIREVVQISKGGKMVMELDALRPGEAVPKMMDKQQALKIGQKYHKQVSNAVSDIDNADPDLEVDPNQRQETLKFNKSQELKDQENTIQELNEMIQAELANVEPKYIAALTKELEAIEADGKADIELANDLYEAAKAAAVCVRGAG